MCSHHAHSHSHSHRVVLFFFNLLSRVELGSHGPRRRGRWKAAADVPRSGRPVGLVEVDVERPRPVGEHGPLRDEAVVAASTPPLMRQIHGALVGSRGLVVMIRHGGMRGRSVRWGGGGGTKSELFFFWKKQKERQIGKGCAHYALGSVANTSHPPGGSLQRRSSNASHTPAHHCMC